MENVRLDTIYSQVGRYTCMMRHSAYRLMFLLLLLVGWQGRAEAQQPMCGAVERQTLESTRGDRPQWGDLGLENVLAVSQPTVEAPTTFRLAHDSAAPLVRRAVMVHHLLRPLAEPSASPHRVVPGYIYKLLCLRL